MGRTDTRRAGDPGELTGPAADLFERLRAGGPRRPRQGVPAYVVFHDATLQAIAAAAPTTSEQLRAISGVGAAKLERYGPGVLATVAGDDGA